jgi:hypothetical protein
MTFCVCTFRVEPQHFRDNIAQYFKLLSELVQLMGINDTCIAKKYGTWMKRAGRNSRT